MELFGIRLIGVSAPPGTKLLVTLAVIGAVVIFDEPVYNFTREFPFIWEEIHVPIPCRANRGDSGRIILGAVRDATSEYRDESERARTHLEAKYGMSLDTHDPRVFWRLTDNWLEMNVRFVVPEHRTREIKDRISRAILRAFDDKGLEIASTTMEISRIAVRLERETPSA